MRANKQQAFIEHAFSSGVRKRTFIWISDKKAYVNLATYLLHGHLSYECGEWATWASTEIEQEKLVRMLIFKKTEQDILKPICLYGTGVLCFQCFLLVVNC